MRIFLTFAGLTLNAGLILSGCVANQPMQMQNSTGAAMRATLYPINAQANKHGMVKFTYNDPYTSRVHFNFQMSGKEFEGDAMTIDSSYRGWGTIYSQASGAAYAGSVYGGGVAFGDASSKSTSASIVSPSAMRGIASVYSPSGIRGECEYTVNNEQVTSTGVCKFSDGSLFRFYTGRG